MSETSETRWRCLRAMGDCDGSEPMAVLADGIDRLAADLAAVKEATLPQTTEERDCALRERDDARKERDDWREEVERLSTLLAQAKAEVGRLLGELAEAKADSYAREDNGQFIPSEREWNELVDRKTAAIRERDAAIRERDEARKERDEAISERDGSRALFDLVQIQRTAAYADRDEARANAERLRGELAARPPAAGWLTDEERQTLLYFRNILLEWSNAPNYPEVKGFYGVHLNCLDALLARAGSPPVVEVPVMHAGGINEIVHVRYRAALDKAGIQWKEAPRE